MHDLADSQSGNHSSHGTIQSSQLTLEPALVQVMEVHARNCTLTVGFQAEIPLQVFVIRLTARLT
ncbi:MAG TPA: hypothetical protein PKD72_15255 [Gemmatales bacterium]|nr:hypothetical protein [Gemmatales bacterium]